VAQKPERAGLFYCRKQKSGRLILSFGVLERFESHKREIRASRYLLTTIKQPWPERGLSILLIKWVPMNRLSLVAKCYGLPLYLKPEDAD
jgi:hypothetical protein